MISALRKIDGKGELEGVPSAVMELCLDNPRSGFTDLFATHPSVDQRVDALQGLLQAVQAVADGGLKHDAATRSTNLMLKGM